MGNGEKVPNEGQIHLNLETEATKNDTAKLLHSTFQVAEVTRPLMSVGRICDQGYQCLFTKATAQVISPDGATVVEFQRQGGLYVTKLKLKKPEPFARPVQ